MNHFCHQEFAGQDLQAKNSNLYSFKVLDMI